MSIKGLEISILMLSILVANSRPALCGNNERVWLSTGAVINFKVDDGGIYRALAVLRNSHKFEFNTGDAVPAEHEISEPNFSINLTSVTVATVLDVVTAADGNFKWDYAGKVLHLAPRSAEAYEKFPALKLLNSRLDFKATAPNMRLLNERLRDAAQEQGLPLYGYPKSKSQRANSGMECEHPGGFAIDSQGGTLRDVLDAIVAADPPAGWRVSPYRQGNREGLFLIIGEAHSHGCPPGTRSPVDSKDSSPSIPQPPAKEGP